MNNMNVDYVTLHYRSVLNDFSNQFLNEEFSDCVLNAEGKGIKVHRAVLCAQSFFLEKMVLEHRNIGELCFIVEGVSFEHLNLVVQFMYNGCTKLNKNNFGPFLVVAELLGVKWLDHIQILSETDSLTPNSIANENEPTDSSVQDNTETRSTSVFNNVASSIFKNITNVLDSKLVKRKKHMKGKKHCKRSKCAKEDRNERKKHKAMHSFRHDHSKNDKVPSKETHLGDLDENTFCTALGLKKNVEVLPREPNSKLESASVKTDQKFFAKSKSVPPLIKINRDIKSNAENLEVRDSNLFVSEINTVYIEDKNLSFINIGANELCIRENNIEIECDVLDASSSQFLIEKEAAEDFVEIREETLIQAEFVDINPESTSEKEPQWSSTASSSSALRASGNRPVLVLQVKDVNESNVVIWYPSKETTPGATNEKNRSGERNCEESTLEVALPNLNIPPGAIVDEDSLMRMIPDESSDVDDGAITPPFTACETLRSTPGTSGVPMVPDKQFSSESVDSSDSETFVSTAEDEAKEAIRTICDEKTQPGTINNDEQTICITNDAEETVTNDNDITSPVDLHKRTIDSNDLTDKKTADSTVTVDAEITCTFDDAETIPSEGSDSEMSPLVILDSDDVSERAPDEEVISPQTLSDEDPEPSQSALNEETELSQKNVSVEEAEPLQSAFNEEAIISQSVSVEEAEPSLSALNDEAILSQTASDKEVRLSRDASEEEPILSQSTSAEEAISSQIAPNEEVPPSQNIVDEEPRPSCSQHVESTSIAVCEAESPTQLPHVESIANGDREMEADCGVQPLPEEDEVVKSPPVIIKSYTAKNSSPHVPSPVNVISSPPIPLPMMQKQQSLEVRHQRFICATKQGSVVYQIPIPKSVTLRKSPRFKPRKSVKKPGPQAVSKKLHRDTYQDYLTRTFNLKPFAIKLNKFRNEKEKKESEKLNFLSNFNLQKRGILPITQEHSYVINRERKEGPRSKRKHAPTVGNIIKRKSIRLTPKNLANLRSVTVELEKLDDSEVRKRVRCEHSYNFDVEDSQSSSDFSLTL